MNMSLPAKGATRQEAGCESGAGTFVNDTLPEEKAAELRAARVAVRSSHVGQLLLDQTVTAAINGERDVRVQAYLKLQCAMPSGRALAPTMRRYLVPDPCRPNLPYTNRRPFTVHACSPGIASVSAPPRLACAMDDHRASRAPARQTLA